MPVGGAGCPFYIECQIERPEKAHTALVGHVCRKECTHNLDPADKNEKVAAGCQQWPCSRPEPGGKGGGGGNPKSPQHHRMAFGRIVSRNGPIRTIRPSVTTQRNVWLFGFLPRKEETSGHGTCFHSRHKFQLANWRRSGTRPQTMARCKKKGK